MKLILFVLGLVIGGYLVHVYDEREFGPAGYVAGGGGVNDPIEAKIQQWHLTPEDIKADLARTGEIVRDNAKQAGDKLGDTRIQAVIKGKYALDKDLSALDIHVDVTDGVVVLTGTVASPELIAKAVVLAMDTGGVKTVTARLKSRT